jgi:molybdate/tungstate transport system substrate-binding protein
MSRACRRDGRARCKLRSAVSGDSVQRTRVGSLRHVCSHVLRLRSRLVRLNKRVARRHWAAMFALACGAVACNRSGAASDTLTVFAAGSLARPLRAALDTIAAAGGPRVTLEIMGSREMIRAITQLGRVPDLLVSADADELETRLMPTYVTTSTTFAHNRVVLAISPKSTTAKGITAQNWMQTAAGSGIRIARADPGRAPLGYRTQLVWRLAELETGQSGLAARLAAASPNALVRGNEADLAALLESGDADAAWCYESLARAMNLTYVTLGDQIDLGSTAQYRSYRRATVRTSGTTSNDSVTIAGEPIRYSIAVIATGRDDSRAVLLRDRLVDEVGSRVMRRIGLAVLDTVIIATSRADPKDAPKR